MGNYHSKTLSPSDAHVWLHCPYSEYLSDLVPSPVLERSDKSYKKIKKAGKQGTVAHKVVEMILKKDYKPDEYLRDFHQDESNGLYDDIRQWFLHCDADSRMDIAIEEDELYSTKMEGYGYRFLDLVKKEYDELTEDDFFPAIQIEKAIDCSNYASNCHGTPDVYIVGKRRLTVIDYKYGLMSVEAENNPQLMIYALGVIENYKALLPELEEVRLIVYQPRKGGEKVWNTTVEKIIEWGKHDLYPASKEAIQSKPEPHYGEWCQYCFYKSCCETYEKGIHSYSYTLDRLMIKYHAVKSDIWYMKKVIKELSKDEFHRPEFSKDILDVLSKADIDSTEIKYQVIKFREKYDTAYYRDKKANAFLDVEYTKEFSDADVFVLIDGSCYSIAGIKDLKAILLHVNKENTVKSPPIIFCGTGEWMTVNNAFIGNKTESETKLEDKKITKFKLYDSDYYLVPADVYTKTNEQLNNYAELLHDFKLLEEGFKWANDVYEAVLNAYKKDDNEVEQDCFDDY